MKIFDLDADIYFGDVTDATDDVIDWRASDFDDIDPDDELLEKTPEDVIRILGFDPLKDVKSVGQTYYTKFNPNHGPDGRFAPGGGGGESRGFDPSSKPKGIEFQILDNDFRETKDLTKFKKRAESLLGTSDLSEIAGVVGAPDGSNVQVSLLGGGLRMIVENEALGYKSSREVFRNVNNELVMYNRLLMIDAQHQHQGIGTKSLAREVHYAAKHKVLRIETEAVRGRDTNGYYTWARLGYDAKIEHVADPSMLPDSLQHAARLSDLMKSKEGRIWWKQFGKTFMGTFDLKDGSTSRKVLDQYVEKKFSSES